MTRVDEMILCSQDTQAQAQKETLFFDDGRRRIDFVLVYKDSKDDSKAQHRETFEENLIVAGMEIEKEDKMVGRSMVLIGPCLWNSCNLVLWLMKCN